MFCSRCCHKENKVNSNKMDGGKYKTERVNQNTKTDGDN